MPDRSPSDQPARLAASLRFGGSVLSVRDIERVGDFYRGRVGLDVLTDAGDRLVLGHDATPILELVSRPDAQAAPPSSAGLYHNAVLYRSPADLAAAVLAVLQAQPAAYAGSADHLVSEAFYFTDPEGNGLELYHDRPREAWQWAGGTVQMASFPLDPLAFVARHRSGSRGQPRELGHVHLKVGDIPAARAFYAGRIGFAVTADLGSALFVSVGGYHHHLGLNTWESQGAGRRTPGLGLAEVRLVLPDQSDLTALADRLQQADIPFTGKHGGLQVSDPWGTRLAFVSGK